MYGGILRLEVRLQANTLLLHLIIAQSQRNYKSPTDMRIIYSLTVHLLRKLGPKT